MASVDDRIVRMEFDNASFERKLGTTLTSLGKLEKSLKFEGATKGLSNVSQHANKFNLSGIANSVQGIQDKFKAMSVIGITALANIATKAITVGADIVKSLTLDNVIAGFKEYEGNIQSIQTILSNTKAEGTNLNQVQAALDKLNEYSDKTIYNFGQMTKNIGTFTAAGVDLDTSVQSIKGISNLAAISGSSAEQAGNAMYQLSQAISTGTLKLQDWNSVTNAGMGGKVFQKALFETGKTLGTIKDVPIDQTFDQWTDAGNSFRGSLQEGWLTGEVLTTTLQGFTGEMTEAQLTAIGYTKEQAAEIIELGKTGVEAATKVRTLTGLIQTTKEAIGSGWSQSFRIIFGNFNEATDLFTGISKAVSDMVSKSADARNELLQGWKDLGGRTLLLESLKGTIKNLGRILRPIKQAFREIFPPATAKSLFNLTKRFSEFAKALRPSKETITDLRQIFRGFFSALDLGWEIIKKGANFIKFLFDSLTGGDAGNFLDFAAKIGRFFTDLNDSLVEGKGLKRFFRGLRRDFKEILPIIQVVKNKIVNFFTGLVDAIKDPVKFFKYIKERLRGVFEGLFDGFDVKLPGIVGVSLGRLGQRFETLKTIFSKVRDVWRPFKAGFDKVIQALDTAWEAIKNWFSELKDKLAKVMNPGDFDAVVDAVNVGLVGGILAVLTKFLRRGIKLDIGEGLLRNIGKSFEELTGIMKAMQTDIKANALLKIAGAIGILTASVLILSLIDSAALTKALTAMAVGFGQLLGAFAIVTKISAGPKGAASFSVIAAGMILLSGAILVLSLAVRVLAGMDWEELGKGLAGVAALMLTLAIGSQLLNASGMVRAGLGMIGVAIAINLLAGAVKLFSMMSWSEMGKGLVGVAGALVAIALGMQLMPKGLALQAVGLLLVATSLNILAGALILFATMDWGQMLKGMVGIAGSLLIIAGAMNLMPATMPLIGAGLLLVSVALIAIAKAMQMIGGLSWEEIAKGMVGIAGALILLAAATYAMQGTIAGSIALGIAAASLLILSEVLTQFAAISWGDLLKGLVGIAAVLATLGISAMLIQPAIPALLALGAALLVIGAGFALFGFGANLVAKAFETLVDIGPKAAKTLTANLKAIGAAIPALVAGFAEGILDIAKIFVKAAPVIAKGLIVLLEHILEGLHKLIPSAIDLIGELVVALLDFIQTVYPKFVDAGIGLLLSLLEGIRDNIGDLVHVVGEIVTEFLDALTAEIPRIVESIQNLIVTIVEAVAIGLNPATLMLMIGSDMLGGLLQGLKDKAVAIFNWFVDLGKMIIDKVKAVFGMRSPSKKFMQLGKDLIKGFFNGIKNAIVAVARWFGKLAQAVLRWVGNLMKTLWDKGTDLIGGFFGGIKDKIIDVMNWLLDIGEKVQKWVGNMAKTLWRKGIDLIGGFFGGIKQKILDVLNWFVVLSDKILNWIGNLAKTLWDKGIDIITGFFGGLKHLAVDVMNWFMNLGGKVIGWIGDVGEVLYDTGVDLIQGLWDGIQDLWDNVWQWVKDQLDRIPGIVKKIMGIESPSKVMADVGKNIMLGLAKGLEDNAYLSNRVSENVASKVKDGMTRSLAKLTEDMEFADEFNPVIRPVLDLTSVQTDAAKIGDYIRDTQSITPAFSYRQAQSIAATANARDIESAVAPPTEGGVKFEQNIYAPKQLSTNDIYKQTRNQIKLAKEELSIP